MSRLKSRLDKLETASNAQFEVLIPLVMCPETETGLSETSVRARYVAGTVAEEYDREDGEDLKSFKDRVRSESGGLMRAAHPNAILLHPSIMGGKQSDCY